MTQEANMFTTHTDARLTFVFGIVVGVSVMTLSGIAFFTYIFNGGSIAKYDIQPLTPTAELLSEPVGEIQVANQLTLNVDEGTQVYGATEDYAVTLIMYVDYECRFCKKFFPEVKEFTEANANKVRLLIKQYPLTKIHPNAKEAARAAVCSVAEGKFSEYTNVVLERQADLSADALVEIQNQVGLTSEAFTACMSGESSKEILESHAREATQLGITSQPNLIVWYAEDNIELIDGYVNRGFLESELRDALQ